MKALVLEKICNLEKEIFPLKETETDIPVPGKHDVLVKVKTCGICHTELDEIEGRVAPSFFPIVPGHQVVGIVERCGEEVSKYKTGDRVGVGWIFSSCGKCGYCKTGNENLCPEFKATGRDANGGYAEYICVPQDSAYPVPDFFSDEEAAPLLCAGAIGYRSLKLTNIIDGQILGLTGFGASGHQVLLIAKHLYPSSEIFVFARSEKERELAMTLGANWAGDTNEKPPKLTDKIIDTTPVWRPVVEALRYLKPSGRLVINAIRKEDRDKDYLLNLNYHDHLWMEKEIKSVANITRSDIAEFLLLAAALKLKPVVTTVNLNEVNKALLEIKNGKSQGAKVLIF
ncbi:MAG: zinc-dependent alcohol dehydrogenase family protein [Bacteroidota bacterium]